MEPNRAGESKSAARLFCLDKCQFADGPVSFLLSGQFCSSATLRTGRAKAWILIPNPYTRRRTHPLPDSLTDIAYPYNLQWLVVV